MWAIINKQQIVIGVLVPNTPLEEITKVENEGFNVVRMTLENSPATIGSKYENGKFVTVNSEEMK